MPSVNALSSELSASNAALAALTTRVANNETAIKALAMQLGVDEATIAKLVTAAASPSIVLPPYDPLIQWQANMETGDLSEWSGQSNSDSAVSTAVLAS